MKTIDTLIKDLEGVLLGLGGWNEAISTEMGKAVSDTALARFSKPQAPRGYLSLSGVGTDCDRKLWYKVNKAQEGIKLKAEKYLMFFYGDMIEELILAMVKASGHSCVGMQDRLSVHGIKGHRDAVIDGMTVDVKTASPFSFKKFKEGKLREEDPFGYVSQLSSYVYAGKDDPLVTNKKEGAFLVINKVTGEMCLDKYDFSKELKTKKKDMLHAKSLVAGKIPDERISPVPASKTSPNTKLARSCTFCDFKNLCWPNARKFQYSYGVEYLVHVEKEPNVEEIFDVEGG